MPDTSDPSKNINMYADLTGDSTTPKMCITKEECKDITAGFVDDTIVNNRKCVLAKDCPTGYVGNNISSSFVVSGEKYKTCVSINDCKSRSTGDLGLRGFHFKITDA